MIETEMPLRALFVGDGSLLIRCAEIYLRAGLPVAGVVTSNRRIAEWARGAGIDLFDWPVGGCPDLASASFDYLFSIANLRIVPPDVLARARRGAINFHDSLLPAYGGLNATSWAIMAGEAVHGITWHEMTAEIDRGRILKQQSFEIRSDDTAFALNARCFEAAAESFAALIDDLRSGRSRPIEPKGPRSWFGRSDRPADAATIDLSWPAHRIVALVRALDFGRYDNPLGRAKLYVGDDVLMVQSAEIVAARPFGPPGRLISIGEDCLVASSADADIRFSGLSATCGSRPSDVLRRNGLSAGDPMPAAGTARLAAVTRLNRRAAAFEGWWARTFQQVVPAALPYPHRSRGEPSAIVLDVASASPGPESLAAAFIAWLARITNAPTVSLAWRDSVLAEAARDIEPWFSGVVPLTIEADLRGSLDALTHRLIAVIDVIRRAGPYCRDLPFRRAGGDSVREALAGLRFGIDLEARPDRVFDDCDVVLSVDPVEARAIVRFPNGMFVPSVAQTIAGHFAFFLHEVRAAPRCSLEDVTLVPPEERVAIDRANRTATPCSDASGIAQEISRQVRRTPDREAIRWGDEALDYAALEAHAASIVRRLEACSVAAGTIVGIHLERTPDLVAAVLAVLSVRAAYLPLDPAYPTERVGLMLEDSHAAIVITESRLAGRVAREGVKLLMLDSEADAPAAAGSTDCLDRANGSPDDLAYVIYTSGSTGRPKGVAITHRNVLNFFAGMDARIPLADGGRWLAVTSLSFDISVLELLWTLARGFTVVLHGAPSRSRAAAPGFSLFYFASEDSSAGGDKYRLLIEGAKFADREGFDAVWTPERHFHAFGGLYPNPAITSAAIAAVTERVAIRAGSCVLPLHNAVRVAEDWALVDNLSNGRVGLSLASGWQPNDFVLAPESFADRKNIMLSGVETLRRLWRGDKIPLRNPAGETVETGTLPRPVQQEIPLWLTAAGNPETFRQAGALRCGVLTHLLGQSLEDLAGKIGTYRQAWRAAGHAGRGHVTLMLHAFVGESDESVRELVRGPMKDYLRSSVDLIRLAAWTFPTFVERAAAAGQRPSDPFDAAGLSEAEMSALLDHAFDRYFESSGLFGGVERCREMVRRLADLGVDEIACLIDFGVPADLVLESLPRLKQVMTASATERRPVQPASVAEDIAAHRITHLQCTPSMASLLVADAAGRSAVASLETLVLGGEAMPMSLAREVRSLMRGRFLNAYGPTETTVWSSLCDITDVGDFVPLGTPIANTSLHVLDAAGCEVPALVPGELHIGGAGVARGYLGRPELTRRRFVPDPFASDPSARLYRTGDIVRRHPGGALEFIGRADNQVKVRGHRVELGEIEVVLADQPGVKEAVADFREDPSGERRLLAWVTARAGVALDVDALRRKLTVTLPDFMVPSRIIVLRALPLTPNGKIDRQALPAVDAAEPVAPPEGDTESLIAAIWSELLGVAMVSRTANFFDLGGHSLMVLQVQRRLKAATGQEIPIVDMFRCSTVRMLADLIDGRGRQETAPSAIDKGISRARARRALLERRAS